MWLCAIINIESGTLSEVDVANRRNTDFTASFFHRLIKNIPNTIFTVKIKPYHFYD